MGGGIPAEARTQRVVHNPSGRIGEPEDATEAVVWLCSEAASFVVGHTLVVDGGVLAQ
jgi:NAD(P)-dependent dehydrogenase (short-subunit alcohol dehydrogenase family)